MSTPSAWTRFSETVGIVTIDDMVVLFGWGGVSCLRGQAGATWTGRSAYANRVNAGMMPADDDARRCRDRERAPSRQAQCPRERSADLRRGQAALAVARGRRALHGVARHDHPQHRRA